MQVYIYKGPVMQFNTCVDANWIGVTRAVSEGKARNNLMYQYKTQHGLLPSSKITLPGEIMTKGIV